LRTIRCPHSFAFAFKPLLVPTLLLLMAAMVLRPCPAVAQVDWGGSRVTGRSLAIPLYDEGETKPVAVVRFGKLGIDYQRRAFFRIGVMPVLSGENAVLEVLAPAQMRHALGQITNAFQPNERYGAVEWRPFKIVVPGEDAPRLEAKQGTWSEGGGLRLTDVRVHLPGQRQFKWRHAYLAVAGATPGWLYERPSSVSPLCDLFVSSDSSVTPATVTRGSATRAPEQKPVAPLSHP
jgi:hypothetical protein